MRRKIDFATTGIHTYPLVDLWNLITEDWYVALESRFLNSMIKKAGKRLGSGNKLAEKLGVSGSTVREWFRGRNKSLLLKHAREIAKEANLTSKEMKEHTLWIKRGKRGKLLSLSSIVIDETFVEGWALVRGDGSIGKDSILLVNTTFGPHKAFIRWMRQLGINKDDLKLNIRVPRDVVLTTVIIAEYKRKWSEELGLPIECVSRVINEYESKNYRGIEGRRECAEIDYYCRGLACIIKRLEPQIREAIRKSEKLRVAYVRGIFAAEASVSKPPERAVQLGKKHPTELQYLTAILNDLGIKCSDVKKRSGMYWLKISDRKSLEKLQEINGFKLHIERRGKLDILLQSYKRYCSPPRKREERYKQIKRVLQVKGEASSKTVSQLIGLSLHHTETLLLEGYEKGLWCRSWVKLNHGCYIYFID